jgi:hypothetical protein
LKLSEALSHSVKCLTLAVCTLSPTSLMQKPWGPSWGLLPRVSFWSELTWSPKLELSAWIQQLVFDKSALTSHTSSLSVNGALAVSTLLWLPVNDGLWAGYLRLCHWTNGLSHWTWPFPRQFDLPSPWELCLLIPPHSCLCILDRCNRAELRLVVPASVSQTIVKAKPQATGIWWPKEKESNYWVKPQSMSWFLNWLFIYWLCIPTCEKKNCFGNKGRMPPKPGKGVTKGSWRLLWGVMVLIVTGYSHYYYYCCYSYCHYYYYCFSVKTVWPTDSHRVACSICVAHEIFGFHHTVCQLANLVEFCQLANGKCWVQSVEMHWPWRIGSLILLWITPNPKFNKLSWSGGSGIINHVLSNTWDGLLPSSS